MEAIEILAIKARLYWAVKKAKTSFVSRAINGSSEDYTLFVEAKRGLKKLEHDLSEMPDSPDKKDIQTALNLVNGQVPFFTDGKAYFLAPLSEKGYTSRSRYNKVPYSFSFAPLQPLTNRTKSLGKGTK